MSYTASYIVNSNSAQGTTDFTFTFPYIKEDHIEVYLNYSKISQGTGSAQYQVITNVSPKLIRLNTGIASANLRVEVRRNSSLGSPLVDYADGSTLTANDLDTSALQSLYIDQELKDNQGKTVSVDEDTGLPSLGESGTNLRLTNVADPTAAQDAATKNYVDTKVFTSSQIQDGTITSADIANGAIVDADVNASAAISGSKLQAATGSNAGSMSAADKTKLDGIDTGAKDDQTAAEIRTLVESATDSNVFTDADHTKLNAAATLTGSETLTNKTLTSPVINEMSGTAVVTSGTSTSDNKTYSAKRAVEIFYGKDTVGEIQSGETWSAADDKVATTSAIDARIIDLVDDVGGFVPIANETSFPAANPDINNGAGTLVSIKEFASSHTPSSGSVTIANGAGSGNTVTITGCGSTVLAAGYGGIIETTSTLHTYTFHRLSPKATEVTTVAGNTTNINTVASNNTNINTVAGNNSNINTVAGINANVTTVAGISSNVTSVANNSSNINSVNSNSSNINTVAGSITNVNNVGGSIANVNTVASNLASVNNFAEQYRISSSQPSSSLNTGDLYFDTTANELRVYNGSSWQGGVTATGNLVSKADIGASSGVPGTGSNGQYLQTNGSGTLSWQTIVLSDYAARSGAEFSGVVGLKGNSEQLKFYDDDDSAFLHFKAPSSVASNVTWTLPSTDGSASQFLKTNGSGTLSWGTVSTVITETDQTISASLTITTGKNAMSVGDVTLASGVILTIPVNSKYILVG